MKKIFRILKIFFILMKICFRILKVCPWEIIEVIKELCMSHLFRENANKKTRINSTLTTHNSKLTTQNSGCEADR